MIKTYQLNLPVSQMSDDMQEDLYQAHGNVSKALALAAARYQAAAAQCTRLSLMLPERSCGYEIFMQSLFYPSGQGIIISGPEETLDPLIKEGLLASAQPPPPREEEHEEENRCAGCGDYIPRRIWRTGQEYCYHCEPDEEECEDEEDDYDD